jgi:hypothetical protein
LANGDRLVPLSQIKDVVREALEEVAIEAQLEDEQEDDRLDWGVDEIDLDWG